MTPTTPYVPRKGPHLVLMALYALFILASGSRAIVQLTTKFHVAPVAYILSAVAAVTYVVGWFAIRRAAQGRPRLASVMLWVELGGVVVIGTLSLVVKRWFPDASVWSDYGGGYFWVPAALPVLGLLWLHGGVRWPRPGGPAGVASRPSRSSRSSSRGSTP